MADHPEGFTASAAMVIATQVQHRGSQISARVLEVGELALHAQKCFLGKILCNGPVARQETSQTDRCRVLAQVELLELRQLTIRSYRWLIRHTGSHTYINTARTHSVLAHVLASHRRVSTEDLSVGTDYRDAPQPAAIGRLRSGKCSALLG